MSVFQENIATNAQSQLQTDVKEQHNILDVEIGSGSDIEDDLQGYGLPYHVVSSPYSDANHQLDLRSLAEPTAQFAMALTSMKAIREDYATSPYALSFNWSEIVGAFSKQYASKLSFFVIVFRSRLKPYADRELLGTLDKVAHLEAVEAGGLLKYWFGTPDRNNRNLATCEWCHLS